MLTELEHRRKRGLYKTKKIRLIRSLIHCLNTPFRATVKENRPSKRKCHVNYPSIQQSNSLYLIMPSVKEILNTLIRQREAPKSPEYLSTEWNGFVHDRDTCYWYPRIVCPRPSGKGRNTLISAARNYKRKREGKAFCNEFFFFSFTFVIAVPERRGQLCLLQGANFGSAICDCRKPTSEDCKQSLHWLKHKLIQSLTHLQNAGTNPQKNKQANKHQQKSPE